MKYAWYGAGRNELSSPEVCASTRVGFDVPFDFDDTRLDIVDSHLPDHVLYFGRQTREDCELAGIGIED
jgi:hypothetical protein